jgi:hypothetical protein
VKDAKRLVKVVEEKGAAKGAEIKAEVVERAAARAAAVKDVAPKDALAVHC